MFNLEDLDGNRKCVGSLVKPVKWYFVMLFHLENPSETPAMLLGDELVRGRAESITPDASSAPPIPSHPLPSLARKRHVTPSDTPQTG